jgi:hypothetical protein
MRSRYRGACKGSPLNIDCRVNVMSVILQVVDKIENPGACFFCTDASAGTGLNKMPIQAAVCI